MEIIDFVILFLVFIVFMYYLNYKIDEDFYPLVSQEDENENLLNDIGKKKRKFEKISNKVLPVFIIYILYFLYTLLHKW